MLISLLLDPARLWRWHATLAEALCLRPGLRVQIGFAAESRQLPAALTLVLQLEQAIGRRGEAHPFDKVAPADLIRWTKPMGRPVVVVDLAGAAPGNNGPLRTLVPLYDGAPGEDAFWAALLDGQAPALALYDSACGTIGIGQPAIESRHALRKSAAAVVTRLMTGLARAVPAAACDGPPAGASLPQALPAGPSGVAAAGLLARKVTVKAQRALDRTLKTGGKWAVAWRRRALGFDPLETGDVDLAAFNLLADDGQRYYADPFLFPHGGFVDVFVEELPYTTGRGIISMFTLRPDGRASAPRPVLETPHHLSYPHVFARDGDVWMLPEASASGGLTLYRAARYPDQWEPAAILVDEPLHDATLFEHDGLLWIAAATQGPPGARWGSSWDSLSLYFAPGLMGPWTPHPGNPVLIDASQARPGGDVFQAGSRLYRPVQDCTSDYGSAIGLAEITRLTREDFAQTVVGRLGFVPGTRVGGPHTLNRARTASCHIEAIDFFAAPATVSTLPAASGSLPRTRL